MSCACAMAACRERRCDRARRECLAESLRAVRSARGIPPKDNCTGRAVDAVTVSASAPSALTLPIKSAAERPTGVSDIWRNAERRVSAATGSSICRNRSPGASTLRWSPVTKSATAIFRSLPSAFQIVQIPSSAAVSAIIGPAGNDMQRLPPTVAVFQILKEARNARQHWSISGEAIHSGGQGNASSCCDGAGCGDGQACFADGQRRPFEIREIDQSREVGLRLREQPGSAGEPRIACRPNGQLLPALRVRHLFDGVQIHG